MYLFFDTETNGLPENWKAPVTDTDNWPRVTQLGWQLYDEDENLISEKSHLIKPDGWEIPKEKFFIDNNMSTERCEEFGIPLDEAVSEFFEDMKSAEYLIAHNMDFDIKVIGSEFVRLDVKPEKELKKICTMKETTSFCKVLPFRYGSYKWPTLTELHVKLFNEEFEGAHDALDDVKACSKSFFELKKLGKILKS